jgi:hypothetical protein
VTHWKLTRMAYDTWHRIRAQSLEEFSRLP